VIGPIINAYNTYAGTAPGLDDPSLPVHRRSTWFRAGSMRLGSEVSRRAPSWRPPEPVRPALHQGSQGGKGSVDLNVDLYNAFNSDAILQEVQNYGVAWRNATSIIQPRFVKFAARWDF
jgi:hypothetical protein